MGFAHAVESRWSWGDICDHALFGDYPVASGNGGIRLPLLNERDNGEKQLEKDILG